MGKAPGIAPQGKPPRRPHAVLSPDHTGLPLVPASET
jgi:hypothetical protein